MFSMVHITTDASLYLLNPLHRTFTVKKNCFFIETLILALVITTFQSFHIKLKGLSVHSNWYEYYCTFPDTSPLPFSFLKNEYNSKNITVCLYNRRVSFLSQMK